MEGATHFIEVYKVGIHEDLSICPCLDIEHINECLQDTKDTNYLKTIAVFKIKLKPND